MKNYFLYFDYGATGEGWTVYLEKVMARSPKAALKKFRQKHKLLDPYWDQGILCLEINPKNVLGIKAAMNNVLSPSVIQNFLSDYSEGFHELSFKFHVNRS